MNLNKRQILILTPIVLIAVMIGYSWAVIFFTDLYANWRHHVALVLFFPLPFFIYKTQEKIALLLTIVYLLIGTANMLSFTPVVTSSSFGIQVGSLTIATPSFQLSSFGILVLALILNFDNLTNYYLDYKESKQKSKS